MEDDNFTHSTSILSLPACLHSALLSEAGTDTQALALTCKALSNLWNSDTTCQALWLLHNSSCIRINPCTRPKLQALAQILSTRPGVDPMELMWVRWSLRAQPGSGYGGCEGSHGDKRSCQFDPNRQKMLPHVESTLNQPSVATIVFHAAAAAAAAAAATVPESMCSQTMSPGQDQDEARNCVRDVDGVVIMQAYRELQGGDSGVACSVDAAGKFVVGSKLAGAQLGMAAAGCSGGAFLQACCSGDVTAVKQSMQSRIGRITPAEHQTAEHIASLTGNTLLSQFLTSSYHAGSKRSGGHSANLLQGPVSYSGKEDWIAAIIKDLILHLRDPLPLIQVCLEGESERSHKSALRYLLSAGKWGMAHSFLMSAPAASDFSLSGWEQLGLAYLANTAKSDRWQADSGPGPLWGAIIDCATRSNMTRQLYAVTNWDTQLWPRIFTFSFAEGGTDQAMDTAEKAAYNFSGHGELVLVAREHRRAGHEDKALRCENLAWHLRNPQGSCAYLHMILDDDDYILDDF